jgi:predicted  nucleic acid-binding Zn-ribbon protein
MTWIADLKRLQEIDTALDSRRASYDDAQSRLGETDELIAARTRAEGTVTALRAAQSAQKDVEVEADDLKSKIAPQETKLYSGAIKNPKELADLQADIDQLKRHLSSIEDRDLEALAGVETADNEHRTASDNLSSIESAWQAEQQELTDRVATLEGEIAEYDAQRNDVAGAVDPAMLATYDRLRRAHQGKGIAKLDRNLCTGCRISLPTNMVNKARAGNALVQCPNCERILYA